ncbi:MAG: flagellar hook-basal body protein [Oscillospiraceae bacterium]|nr:flagellar hook-basal body protein [Oscillospiraceae bacterium]
MINGFYSARSGAIGSQNSLDITANNIANVNTQGYKTQRAVFSELMSTTVNGSDISVGNGSRVSAVNRDTENGAPANMGLTLDAAIHGDGYFAVKGYDGEISYTRCGNFLLSEENGANYLVTSSGEYILGADGGKIKVENGSESDSIYKAALYRFDNPEAMMLLGGGKYAVSENSGEAIPDSESEITVHTEEQSNVEIISEMTDMIRAQRSFQYNIKMVQTADEIEQTVNSLRN